MSEETQLNTIQLLKQAEREIQEAQAEVRVRQKQINELKPRRAQLEEQCREQFECSPSELPSVLNEKKAEADKKVADFVSDLKIAKES